MKHFLLTLAAMVVSCYADEVDPNYVSAIRNGAEARYVYRVSDEDGMPIQDAVAHVWFRSYGRPQDKEDWIVSSDSNGMFAVSHVVNERFSVSVEKEGFYKAFDRVDFLSSDHPATASGKWLPYGEERVLKMKRVAHLGGLCVLPREKRMGNWRIPVKNEWIAFDLEKCDWVAPYGKGLDADVLLRMNSSVVHPITNCAFRMDVSFTNNPYAGGYIRRKDPHSDLKWCGTADANEVYKSEFSFVREIHGREMKNQIFLPEDSYLVFRTRSTTDEGGMLKTIHYGVISGEWGVGNEAMRYEESVFNPNENDPSIEDSLFLRERNRSSVRR